MNEVNFDKEIEQLKEFLKTYPEAGWRPAVTMYEGYVTLLKPVKTLFGAEYQCHPNTYRKLKDMGIV